MSRRNPARDARRSGPYCEMTDDELMSLVSAGLTEEESRRFKKTLAVDNGDDSVSEVCFAFPRRILGSFVLRNEMMPAQAAKEQIINNPKRKLPEPRQPAKREVPPPSQRPPCQSRAPFKFVLMLRPSSREPGWAPCHCHRTCMACVAAENFAPAPHVRFPPAERKEKMPWGRMQSEYAVRSRKVHVQRVQGLWACNACTQEMRPRQGPALCVQGLWACKCTAPSAKNVMRPRQGPAQRVRGLQACTSVTLQEVMRPRQGHALQVQTVRTMNLLL
jgi:hypothetical protein